MRFVTYATKRDPNILLVGLELPERKEVVDVAEALNLKKPLNMCQFLAYGEPAKEALQAAVKLNVREHRTPLWAVTIKAPVQKPEKIICIGMNYVDHCLETGMEPPKEPVVFNKYANCILNPGEDIEYEGAVQTEELDFEVELVIVIGKTGRAIPKSRAMEYVAGYTVAHDVSARDWQIKRNGGQWLMGKTMDGFAPIGPAIVTTDEVGDPHNLGLRTYLNDKEVQNSNTNQLVFKTEDIVEWCSRFNTLNPGDLIFTGTPPGVGLGRTPRLWLKDGDVVRVEIDNIGAISNRVREIPVQGPPLRARL